MDAILILFFTVIAVLTLRAWNLKENKLESQKAAFRERQRTEKDNRKERLTNPVPLGVIEAAEVAEMVTGEINIDHVLKHIKLLARQNEIENALEELNSDQRPVYRIAVTQSYGVQDWENLWEDHRRLVNKQVERCMELGLQQLMLHESLEPYLEGRDESSLMTRRIEKKKSWDDLKDKL